MNRFLAGIERRAFRMARLATSDDDEALDIVQDALFGFVKRYAERPESEWQVLFHRTLQSRIVDWYRRASLRNRLRVWFGSGDDDETDVDPIQNVADNVSPDPAESLVRKAAAAAIDQALRALPLRQRQAFLLRAWEGLDVAATASAMGCSQGSVKTHYSRAVHAMREQLEEFRP